MFEPGQRVDDRYTVQGVLGEGGMGTVYEVRSDALGHRLAMKVMNPSLVAHDVVVERFRREASIQATVSHPGITRVFDLVDRDDLLAIVMEYVPAPTLRQRIEAGPMPEPEIRGVAFELLSILMACHAEGVAHRDLKPENIFVSTDGHGTIRCKLADFGVAKRLSEHTADGVGKTRAFVGTYTYASPEQINASGDIDERSDLYSLGVILWEMLSGVPPYGQLDSAYAVQVAVVTEDLPRLPPTVPADLRRLVAELTRKERTARPASTTEALKLLQTGAVVYEGATVGMDLAAAGGRHAGATVVDERATVSDPLLDRPLVQPARPVARPSAPAAPTPSPRAVTEWDPSQANEVKPPPAPQKRSRHWRLQQDRQARLQTWTPAPVLRRLPARALDEFLLALLAISCVGIVAYPFVSILRGTTTGRGPGGRALGVRVFSARTGMPATGLQMMWRNTIDLVLFQGGLALALWTGGVFTGGVLNLVGAVWALVFIVLEVAVLAVHPEGRRIADLLAGTRVGRDA